MPPKEMRPSTALMAVYGNEIFKRLQHDEIIALGQFVATLMHHAGCDNLTAVNILKSKVSEKNLPAFCEALLCEYGK